MGLLNSVLFSKIIEMKEHIRFILTIFLVVLMVSMLLSGLAVFRKSSKVHILFPQLGVMISHKPLSVWKKVHVHLT